MIVWVEDNLGLENKPADWHPPRGHKSWCDTQLPFSRAESLGDTPMGKAGCNCGQNRLAKSLRKLSRST